MAPLSEHEKRQLRLMEERFEADDPKFVQNMRAPHRMARLRFPRTRKYICFGAAAVGLVMLVTGIMTGNVLLGSAGYLVAMAAIYRGSYWLGVPTTPSVRHPKPQSAFMANLERQWDERKNNENI